MPYIFYQVVHVLSLLLLTGVGFALIASDNDKPLRKFYGILSFLVLLGGFGLIAKLGYSFKENTWLTVKLGMWILLAGGLPIALKRLSLSKPVLMLSYGVILFIAVYSVYLRPF